MTDHIDPQRLLALLNNEGVDAVREHLRSLLPGPTMADCEWDDTEHAGLCAIDPYEGLVRMINRDGDGKIFFLATSTAGLNVWGWAEPRDLTPIPGTKIDLTPRIPTGIPEPEGPGMHDANAESILLHRLTPRWKPMTVPTDHLDDHSVINPDWLCKINYRLTQSPERAVILADTLGLSTEKMETPATRPEDVPVREAWAVRTDDGTFIGTRNLPDDEHGQWILAPMSSASDGGWEHDSEITLLHRLAPEVETND